MESILEGSGSANERKRTWSAFWSGLIWFVVGFILIMVSQFAMIITFVALEVNRFGTELSEERIQELAFDGDVLSFGFLIILPIIVAVLAFVVKKLRRLLAIPSG